MTISLALIGCGEVAQNGHLPAILRNSQFKLIAACDIDPARLASVSRHADHVATYADWRTLLARESVDAVVIALPPEVSPEVAVAALERKLAVLDEKPMAATLTDGRRLQRAVKDYAGIYQVGFVLRYGEWVERIAKAIPSLGTPLSISVEVYDERLDPEDQEHLARILGFIRNSSAMTHEGSHVIDYVSLWHPLPWKSASSIAQQTSPTFSGPNLWNAMIEFVDHSVLNVKIGWLLPKLPPSTVTVVGPEGRLDFDCRTGRGHIDLGGVEQPFIAPPLGPSWDKQYEAFATAIRTGKVACATSLDGLRALEVTAACELSAHRGVAVTPEDLEQEASASEYRTSTASSAIHSSASDSRNGEDASRRRP
jgi:myo-inositol 2-dehydrogenase/D-chiro-inositol 1-dehydrogenase